MKYPITLLLLEDNNYDAELTLHELRKQGVDFHATHAKSKAQFIEGLKKKPDVILADYSLPQFNANEALSLMKELGYDTPVIVISGTIGEESAVEMMRHGAADYLMKDRLGRLSTAIISAIESAELREINDQYMRELEESNARYKSLFDDSPISLWEEDFSSAKQFLDELTASGVTDLRQHFKENHADMMRLCQSRNLIAINQATIDLYDAASKEEAYEDLSNIQLPSVQQQFVEYAVVFYEGATEHHSQAWHTTVKGDPIYVSIHIAIAPNHLKNWDKVYISIVNLTEQARAQQQLVQSESLLRNVIDSSPDSIIVKDKDFTVQLANQATADTIGSTVEAMLGKNEEEIGYPKDWIFGNPAKGLKGFRETDRKVMEEGVETREIFPFPVGEELRYFEEFKKPLRDAGGKITSELVYSRDITEIVKAQKDLEQSEKLLRAVINSSPDSILVKDRNQVIFLANQATADDLGVTPEFMIGKTDVELGYTHDQIFGNPEKGIIGFRELDKVVFEQGTEAHQVIPFVLNGEMNYFDAYEVPLRDAEGNVTSALVYSRNITEIIQAQKDLEQSEALLRSIFDSSSDWIFVKDKEHRYILVNREFINGFGLPESEIIGKTDFDIGFSPESATRFQNDDNQIMESGKAVLFEDVCFSEKEGFPQHFSTMKSPLFDSSGEIWGIMGIARDISERLQRENELSESRKNYESLFNSLVDSMYVHDMLGNILVANPIAQKRLGYTAEELAGKTIQDLSSPINAEERYQNRINQLQEFGHIKFTTTQITKDGNLIPMEVSSNLVEFGGNSAVLSIMRDITDVIEAEIALAKSEEQYRTLLNTVPDVIILCESNGNIVHVNQTVSTLTGYNYEELITKRLDEIIDDTQVTVQSDGEIRLPSGRSNLVLEIKTHEGANRLLDITTKQTSFNGESVLMLVGRDQTDRILAERKSQETERLLRTMIDIIPQPIFVFDEDGYYVMANQNIAELYQTDKENIIGKTNADLANEGIISAEEAVVYHENAMIPLMTREPFFRPVDSYTDPDGIQHWFQIYTTPFRLPDKSMWVVGVGNEITHQMQAQNRLEAMNEALERRVEERTRDLDLTNLELQKAKEQLESMLAHSPDGFLLLDTDLNIQLMNPAFSRLIGIEVEKNIGNNVMKIVSAKNKELLSNSIQQAIDNHSTVNVEHQATHIDGSKFDCLTSISPIYSEDILLGVVMGVHDITPQKEVQRMKDAFVSNVSHELRTPITNFICNLELIRMNPKKSDVYLERLDLEIVQLKNIIEDLLRLSRFDQNATSLNLVPFDLNLLCEEFSSLRTPMADQKNLSMAFIPTAGLPKITADYGLISQVLSITLTNAINYTPEGGEILIRSYLPDEQHPGMVAFSVSDNGPGIVDGEKEKIFERFFRGQAGIESNVAGTGLGLPIAYEIIERHHGKIEVFSSGIPGEGTTFWVWLPISPNDETL
ncbi:MAG: PAS domain S-box protein [Anaerolineae bacterium]|nr:PAS domain S-box protein [Anaerolineae bacterium]